MNSAVSKNLISERYKNDGLSIMPLNSIQKKYIERFKSDKRIKYKEIEKCPLCNNAGFTLIAEKDRYGISLETVACDRCGLIFTHNQMTQDSNYIFYSEYYRSIYEGVENPTREYLEERYNTQKDSRIPKFLNPNSVVVEIGTGGGWNLIRFQRRGFRHYGFDYDESYINFGKKEYGLNLYLGGLGEARNLGVKADYVILPHVLEHTTNHLEFLAGLKDIMKDRAILNISLPMSSLLIAGGSTAGYDLLGILQNAHNFLFDEFTLKYLALKSGYSIKVVLGENIVLRKVEKDCDDNIHLYELIDNKLKYSHRGAKVIRYLKICEGLIPVKDRIKRIMGEEVFSKLQHIYYISRPFDLGKKYLMSRLGIIL